jgi:hypothetical protein
MLLCITLIASCAKESPFLYSQLIDLDKGSVVETSELNFPNSHWAAILLSHDDYVRLTPSELERIPATINCSIKSERALEVVRFDESFRAGNTMPKNTIYLCNIVGPGTGRLKVDFAGGAIPAKRFLFVVIKHPVELKDPQVHWPSSPEDTGG